MTISSHTGALVGRQLGPLSDVPKPVVPGTASWSFTTEFALTSCSQDVVSSLDVSIVHQFSSLDVIQELPFSVQFRQNIFIGHFVFPADVAYSS